MEEIEEEVMRSFKPKISEEAPMETDDEEEPVPAVADEYFSKPSADEPRPKPPVTEETKMKVNFDLDWTVNDDAWIHGVFSEIRDK